MKKKQNSGGQPSAEQLPAMLHLCQKMAGERDLTKLLILLAREAANLVNCEGASILLYDEDNCELWSQVTLDGEPIRFDARLGVAGAALMEGTIINVSNAQQDPRFYAGIDRRTKKRTRNLLAIPLKTKSGELIGVFEAMNKKVGSFTRRDQEVGAGLASQAALALENAKLFQKIHRQHEQLFQENTQLWKEVEGRFSTKNLIGTSPQMQSIVRLIDQLQDTSVDIMITGENGTGKEVVAKAIHYNSLRARRPFVAMNCAAIPDNLVESELFGIEKGVATGVEPRIGKFEQADGGTLFLDEIGDLGRSAQAKILRVLQERVIERVGGRRSIPIDVRILAATNKNLEEVIKRRAFREDLYYRLKVVHIHTPSLRDIPQDIPVLANYFLHKYCLEMQKERKKFSQPSLRRLEAYSWPGNVRQLENEIIRLVVTVRRATITEDDLDESICVTPIDSFTAAKFGATTIHQAVADLEQQMIRRALQACHYNQVQTAKGLGLSRQGLIKKMKRYKIRTHD